MTENINLPQLPNGIIFSPKQTLDYARAAVLADRAQRHQDAEYFYEMRLRAVSAIINDHLPPDGIPADVAVGLIIGLVDPWPVPSATYGAQRQAVPFNREYVHGYLSEILAETVGGLADPEICALMDWLSASPTPPASTEAQLPTAEPIGNFTLPAIGEFWPEQGGVYAGVMRGADGAHDYHLIVGSEEVQSIAWGGYGTKVDGADSESDGLANTQALCAAATEHPAAQWAAGLTERGMSDWYLPSRRELRLLWVTVPELFSKDDWYWSSTQYSSLYAWYQNFDYGNQYYDDKKAELRARAVRMIQLNP